MSAFVCVCVVCFTLQAFVCGFVCLLVLSVNGIACVCAVCVYRSCLLHYIAVCECLFFIVFVNDVLFQDLMAVCDGMLVFVCASLCIKGCPCSPRLCFARCLCIRGCVCSVLFTCRVDFLLLMCLWCGGQGVCASVSVSRVIGCLLRCGTVGVFVVFVSRNVAVGELVLL